MLTNFFDISQSCDNNFDLRRLVIIECSFATEQINFFSQTRYITIIFDHKVFNFIHIFYLIANHDYFAVLKTVAYIQETREPGGLVIHSKIVLPY